MALDKQVLVDAIRDLRNIDIDSGGIENDQIADRLAEAIDQYVKGGEVIITGGSSAGTYPVE